MAASPCRQSKQARCTIKGRRVMAHICALPFEHKGWHQCECGTRFPWAKKPTTDTRAQRGARRREELER